MNLPALGQRIGTLCRRLGASVLPALPVLTRVVIGTAFLRTGLGKWRNFESTIQFFTELGIPAPTANAAMVATVELVGGILLLLGAGTRAVAVMLSGTMVVALLTADRGALFDALGLGSTGLTDVVPLVFLLFLAWLLAMGAGPLSVDHAFARRTAAAPAAA
jgi:putative oxidoreductase